jgi:hypothetical protein
MNYTQQQLDEFKREFALRRKRQLMVAIPFVLVIVGFAVFARFAEGGGDRLGGVSLGVFFAFFFTLIAGVLMFSFRNWRCPACGRYLGRGMSPRFCSKCGVALQ